MMLEEVYIKLEIDLFFVSLKGTTYPNFVTIFDQHYPYCVDIPYPEISNKGGGILALQVPVQIAKDLIQWFNNINMMPIEIPKYNSEGLLCTTYQDVIPNHYEYCSDQENVEFKFYYPKKNTWSLI